MHVELIKLEKRLNPSVLTKLSGHNLDQSHIELWLKRDDLLHPIISGNKWRKLKYVLDYALNSGATTMISMGGGYSNHLHALAYVGKALGLKTKGIVRGEHTEALTPTLKEAESWGMEIRFVSRTDYRLLRQSQNWTDFFDADPKAFWLPEGGKDALALKGVAELVKEIDIGYDTLCVACGTGATLAGLISAAPPSVSVLGFAALNHAGFLTADIESLLPHRYDNWQIMHDYHFGGFAKTNAALLNFIQEFETKTGIPLEPVYTGKLLYGVYDLIANGYFKAGQRIIAVHTGGLQGNRGFR